MSIRHGFRSHIASSICLLLVIVVTFIPGCSKGECQWVPGGREWRFSALGLFSGRVIGCVTLDQSITLDAVQVKLIHTIIPIDTMVSPLHKTTITNEMLSLGLFNPATESIYFYRTTAPVTVSSGNHGRMLFTLNGGQIVTVGRMNGLAAREVDVNVGNPIPNAVITEDYLGPIATPTVTEWGLIVLSATLVGVGIVCIRRRQTGIFAHN